MQGIFVVALLLTAACPLPLVAQQPLVLTDGTTLRVKLNRNISSAEAKVGDPVDFDVVDDVLVGGVPIIQRGSKVLATVTEAKSAGSMGKSGRLNLSIDYARSVAGEKIALRAVKEPDRSRSGGGTLDLAASIVTAPLALLSRGKDVVIPKGTEVTAYVHGDVRLDEARLRPQPLNPVPVEEKSAPTAGSPPPPAVQQEAAPSQPPPEQSPPPRAAAKPSGMTNADVLALKGAGFSDDLIVSKIKSSKCAFRMETTDLIELKKAGLSDRVIGAMMDKTQ